MHIAGVFYHSCIGRTTKCCKANKVFKISHVQCSFLVRVVTTVWSHSCLRIFFFSLTTLSTLTIIPTKACIKKIPQSGDFFKQEQIYSATSAVAGSADSTTGADAFFAFTSRSTNSMIAIGAASP